MSNPKLSRSKLELLDFTSVWHPEFQYKTEFQSHKPEVTLHFVLNTAPRMCFMPMLYIPALMLMFRVFIVSQFDYLKSLEIEEKINKVRWCATPNGSQFILSTNDKTIKLWKVSVVLKLNLPINHLCKVQLVPLVPKNVDNWTTGTLGIEGGAGCCCCGTVLLIC